MARKKKSAEEKAAAALAKLMNIKAPTPEETIQRAREEEAILAYADNPTLFSKVKCKRCSTVFAVNRKHVAYCSDPCREKALRDLGITRDPSLAPRGIEDKDYVWRVYWGNEPLIVPGEVVQQIDEYNLRSSEAEKLIVPTTEVVNTVTDSRDELIDSRAGKTGFDDLDAILFGT